MPRSYHEWMNAKRNWLDKQSYEIASIPYPGESIGYPIVYQRESTNPYWERRRADAAETIPTSISFSFKLEEIETFIRSAAEFERAKEDEFLAKFYKYSGSQFENESRTDKFNILFQSRDLYKEFDAKIKNILNNKQYQKNKTYGKSSSTTHEYYTGMAPNLSTVFITYFMDDFENNTLPAVYKMINANMPVTTIEDLVNQAIEKSVYNASERMAQIAQENDNGQGWGNQWQPIFDMLNTNSKAAKMLTETVKSAIGGSLFERLQIELQNQKRDKRRLSKGLIRDMTKSSLGNVRGRTASIGGSVLEPVIALIAEYFNGGSSNGDGSITYNMAALNLGGNKVVTDAMMLFSTNMELDLDQLLMQISEAMNQGDSNTIREVYKRIENLNTFELGENLDELYQVYVNAKNYQLGADGRNYTKSYQGQLEELPDFLRANGVSIGSTIEFLKYAYNTAAGAIREGDRFALEEETCNALKAVTANIMFDDYQEIGHGSTHSIHMYYLSGKYIPASEVLFAMANAAAEARTTSKATVTLPAPIKDVYQAGAAPDYGYGGTTNAEIKQNIYRRWQEESAEAKVTSTWSVSFTLRIKELLGGVV